jgi:hypothetical protein
MARARMTAPQSPKQRSIVSPTTLRRALVALSVGAAALVLPSAAGAFGTIDGKMGQHAEHEKITRVLACNATDRPERCFQPLSMDQLSGTKGTLGGVGIPDSPLEILGHPEAHCDDADYLPGAPYTPGDAQRAATALTNCVTNFGRNLDKAVGYAGGVVDVDGKLKTDEVQLTINCTMGVVGPRDKCNSLEYLGRALHAAEDFWSHTNWGDQANPAKPQILKPATTSADGVVTPAVYDITNPAGLGHTDLVPYLRYPVPTSLLPTATGIATGVDPISGCDDSAEVVTKWVDTISDVVTGILIGGEGPKFGAACPNRVAHSSLNKDKGEIDPRTGRATSPDTPRGQIANNFQTVVTGARNQAKAVWGDFATAVLAKYGTDRGTKILTALTSDTPWTACAVDPYDGKFAAAPPKDEKASLRSVTTTIENRTGETLTCGATELSHGEWASLPPDTIASGQNGRFRVESQLGAASGGPEGRTTLAIGGTGYAVRYAWDNPIVGSNRMTCEVLRDGAPDSGAPYRCSVRGVSGNDATPTVQVTNR